jgi:hypothetical protein
LSEPKEPLPAKLLIGLIFRGREEAEAGWRAMEEKWGPVEILSPVRPFTYSRYYEKEMGRPLYRRWAFFRELVPQGRLVRIKHQALALEALFSREGRRRLNIDPGLLTAERLVLSTGKNYSHRIYLGEGIYGDLTLIFHRGAFQPLTWTYPDYREQETLSIFQTVREKYLRDVNQARLLRAGGEGKQVPPGEGE